MSYKSPIEIFMKKQNSIEIDIVNNIYKTIQSYGINIDKDELIKALKYDRNQYEKGFQDGRKYVTDSAEEIEDLLVDFDEMGFSPTTLCEDPEEYAIQWRNNMRNAIEKHETDLLKEFVVYLQSTEKYKAIDEYIDSMGISWGKRYMSANHHLNQDLEDFLKERER